MQVTLKKSSPLFSYLITGRRSISHLSPSQVNYYNRNGYLILESLVPDSATNAVKDRLDYFKDTILKNHTDRTVFKADNYKKSHSEEYFLTSGDKIRPFWEEKAFNDKGEFIRDPFQCINKIAHAMHDLDPVFETFSYNKIFKGILQSLSYVDPMLVQSMLIFKHTKIGGGVKPHKDNTYLITSPLSTVGVWIALEEANESNGCMWAVPGSHKEDPPVFMLRDNKGGTEYVGHGGKEMLDLYDMENAVPLDVPRGTVILLHGNLLHWSGPNTSGVSRYAYTLHFVEGHQTKYHERNWLQRPTMPFRRYYDCC